jgi:hypothetical protein
MRPEMKAPRHEKVEPSLPPRLSFVPDGARAFDALWRSEPARRALEAGRFDALLKMLGGRGWLLAEPAWTEEKLHFHAWHSDAFMAWPRAGEDAKVKALEDLTALHEWLHMATLPAGFASETAWLADFRANEIAVSLESEVLVRWRAPGLQEAALPGVAFWADQVALGRDAWRGQPGRAEREGLWAERLAADPMERAMRDRFGREFVLGEMPESWATTGWTPLSLWDARRQASLWPEAGNEAEQGISAYEAGSWGWMRQWLWLAPEIEANRLALRAALAEGRAAEGWQAFADRLGQSMGELGAPWESMLLAPGAAATPLPAASAKPKAASRRAPGA